MAPPHKQRQIKALSEALRSFVMGYKAWLEDALRREKLTLPQLRLLRAIEEGQGQSAAGIARSLFLTPQTLQTMLERAVRERWIVRSHTAANQRILTAALTARGQAVLARGKELSAQYDAQIWAGISADAVQHCADTLLRGVGNMERIRAAEADHAPVPARRLPRKA